MTNSRDTSSRRFRLLMLTFVFVVVICIAWLQRNRLAALPNSLAQSAITQHDDAAAEKWLRVAERLAPQHPESEFLRARLRRRQGRMDEAERHLKRAKYLGFNEKVLQRENWLAAAQAGQMRTAEPHLAALLQNPGDDGAEICEAYVIGYLRVRRFASALELIEAWVRDFPGSPRPHFWAGYLYRQLNDLESAEQHFRQALAKDPHHAQAAVGLGELLLLAKQPDQAESHFRTALQTDNQSIEASLGLARSLLAQGKIEPASTILDEILKSEPLHSEAILEKANVDIELGDYEQAAQRLRPAVEQNERNRELRFAYATALRSLGRHDQAQSHFEYAALAQEKLALANNLAEEIAERPEDAQLRHQIGSLYLQYGSPQEGLIWLYSALENDPAHRPTLQALADYYAQRAAEDRSFAPLAERFQAQIEPLGPVTPASDAPLQ